MALQVATRRSTDRGDSKSTSRLDPNEEKEVKAESIAFERTVGVDFLTEADFVEQVGLQWRSVRHKKLDFSSKLYSLESLGSHTDAAERRGLMHPHLQRSHLEELNVSNNRLTDLDILTTANGFGNLTIIMAKHNHINQLELRLPRLMEINISHNGLKTIPSFQGCPLLEVFIGSHNRLRGSLDILLEAPRLKRVDLAYNEYMFLPSELGKALDVLKQLRALENLRLANNPFVECFKEYQVFVISALMNLEKLDGIKISWDLREDIKDNKLGNIASFDGDFLNRQKALAQSKKNDIYDKDTVQNAGRFPRLCRFIVSLEDILEGSTHLQSEADALKTLAKYASYLGVVGSLEQDGVFWTKLTDQKTQLDNPEGAVSHFLTLTLSAMERHETIRMALVKMLTYLSCVSKYALGEQCMGLLGRMMVTSQVHRYEVSVALQECLVPIFGSSIDPDLKSKTTRTLVLGLVELMKTRSIREEVSKSLIGVVPALVDSLVNRTSLIEVAMTIKLLVFASESKENLPFLGNAELCKKLLSALFNKSISENEEHGGLWLDLLRMAENLTKQADASIVDIFAKSGLHVDILSKAKKVFMGGNFLEYQSEARTLAGSLNYTTAIMSRSIDVLRECCGPFRLVSTCCAILKQSVTDPMVLAAACRCLKCTLEDSITCVANIGEVSEDLGKLTPLLNYLGGKKYPDLYWRSLEHQTGKSYKQQDQAELLPTQICDVAADALVAIIDLIRLFAENNETEDAAKEQRQLVNYYLNLASREKILLKLLIRENDEVKIAVMECISKVPLTEIEPEEIGLIIKRLAATTNVGAGRTEEVLALVVKELERLASSSSEAGYHFRTNFAEVAIAEAFEVLYKNVQRLTYGEGQEEEQKLCLSVAIVSFFVVCSRFADLRGHLRNSHISDLFPVMLRFEEQLHDPLKEDVTLEHCWIGRSLENLCSCLVGPKVLDRRKKVFLRVICRIADITEGRTDGLLPEDGGKPRRPAGPLLAQICEREASMWNYWQVRGSLKFLDDQESSDRNREFDKFANANGLLAVLSSLCDYRLEDRLEQYQTMIAKAREMQVTIEEAGKRKDEAQQIQDKNKRARETPDNVKLEEVQANLYEDWPGRKVLMVAVQQIEESAEKSAHTLFSDRPAVFKVEEGIFLDAEQGIVNPAYAVAALLRMFWTFLVVPPSEVRRQDAVRDLRSCLVLTQLLHLLEELPLLQCHVASKFLRVMMHAYDLRTTSAARSPIKLEQLYLLSVYCTGIATACLGALRLARDSELGQGEQALCMELARFLHVMVSCAMSFRFSDSPETQKAAITECVNFLVPPVMLRFVVAVIVYDLQMDHGGGSRNAINDHLVSLHHWTAGMKEYATALLAKLIVTCPDHKYDVFEVLCVSEVFLHQTIRDCYLNELLKEVNMGTYMQYVESTFLRAKNEAAAVGKKKTEGSVFESLLFAAIVEVVNEKNRKTLKVRILCCTTRRVYLLAPSDELPPYMADVGSRWDPGLELAFPRDPAVVWECGYRDIAKIYKCYGEQIITIEWRANALPIGQAGAASANTRGHEIIMFHRARDCDVAVNIFLCCAGSGNQVDIAEDPTLTAEVLKRVGTDKVLASTVAVRQRSAAEVTLDGEPCLFVMTMKSIFQFELALCHWQCPTEASQALSEASQAVKTLILQKTFNLPPSEIIFETTQEAVLTLKGMGEELRIAFYDDSGREHWRKALTKYLSQLDKAWERQHLH